jgi:hypothetical protein
MGKGLLKLLAGGALVGAAVHLYKKNDGDKKAAAAAKVVDRVGKKVSAHAKKVGMMTKSSFKTIVNEVTADLKEAKEMSKKELSELKAELVKSWDEVEAEMKKKPAKKTAKKKASKK